MRSFGKFSLGLHFTQTTILTLCAMHTRNRSYLHTCMQNNHIAYVTYACIGPIQKYCYQKVTRLCSASCLKLIVSPWLDYKPFHSSSFRYRLTYIDRYVTNSGCVMRTGYFYPNQSRRLKM